MRLGKDPCLHSMPASHFATAVSERPSDLCLRASACSGHKTRGEGGQVSCTWFGQFREFQLGLEFVISCSRYKVMGLVKDFGREDPELLR